MSAFAIAFYFFQLISCVIVALIVGINIEEKNIVSDKIWFFKHDARDGSIRYCLMIGLVIMILLWELFALLLLALSLAYAYLNAHKHHKLSDAVMGTIKGIYYPLLEVSKG